MNQVFKVGMGINHPGGYVVCLATRL